MQGKEKGAGDGGGEKGDAVALAVALPLVLTAGRVGAIEDDTARAGQQTVGRGRSVPRDEKGGRNGHGRMPAVEQTERVPRGNENTAIVIKAGSDESRSVGKRGKPAGKDVGRGKSVERGGRVSQKSVISPVV